MCNQSLGHHLRCHDDQPLTWVHSDTQITRAGETMCIKAGTRLSSEGLVIEFVLNQVMQAEIETHFEGTIEHARVSDDCNRSAADISQWKNFISENPLGIRLEFAEYPDGIDRLFDQIGVYLHEMVSTRTPYEVPREIAAGSFRSVVRPALADCAEMTICFPQDQSVDVMILENTDEAEPCCTLRCGHSSKITLKLGDLCSVRQLAEACQALSQLLRRQSLSH